MPGGSGNRAIEQVERRLARADQVERVEPGDALRRGVDRGAAAVEPVVELELDPAAVGPFVVDVRRRQIVTQGLLDPLEELTPILPIFPG